MKDYKPMKGVKLWKCHLYVNISETFEVYKSENEENHPIDKSKFAALRPENVLPLNKMPHKVCIFNIHENILLCVSLLSKLRNQNLPTSGRDRLICDSNSSKCIYTLKNSCEGCISIRDYYTKQIPDLKVKTTYFQWKTVDKRVQKVKVE
ncbi:unnamed protein product [Lepeophtheirus salmonis]|uniref:(salmon louse) hypothetical protein n=1 Tax=Lepeophtheirus salmonis TaxID=72036 RepID=A0A7R8CND0_LEPSM|nr:unnamed protein product [Lepeophtheirus salmonis]CAF2840873.1 unnamed protein product [Lepeophtheirus salmonis]